MTPRTFALAASIGAALLTACGSGTDGRAVVVSMAIESEPEPGLPLGVTRTRGPSAWTVELTEAFVSIGAVYLFPPRTTVRRSFPSIFVGRALAHAGDDNLLGVAAIAEHREPFVFDALRPEPLELGTLWVEAREVSDASLWLGTGRGPLDTRRDPERRMRGHHAWVSGIARRDGVELAFEGGLELPDTPLQRRVDLVPVIETMEDETIPSLDEGRHIRVRVRPGRWLERVDFDALLAEAGDEAVMRPPGTSQFYPAFFLGLRNPGAFSVEVTETDAP